jgi:hypothetical protein
MGLTVRGIEVGKDIIRILVAEPAFRLRRRDGGREQFKAE